MKIDAVRDAARLRDALGAEPLLLRQRDAGPVPPVPLKAMEACAAITAAGVEPAWRVPAERGNLRIDEFVDRVGRECAGVGVDQETMDRIVLPSGKGLEILVLIGPALQFVIVERDVVLRHNRFSFA